MLSNILLGGLAILSGVLMFWQWLVARRFALHQRGGPAPFPAAVTLLKPLKGCDAETEACLRSWFAQDYTGRVQILFGVASSQDPVCEIVRKLQTEFPRADAELVVCGPPSGTNSKVAKLAKLQSLARHDLLIISDADVRVPPDLLTQLVLPLREPEVGLVNCFYQLANPTTVAMRWEGIAINADFWSQVLQAQSLKPLDFALGAVIALRRQCLEEIGGFKALSDCLADDYQLGRRIARQGHRIALTPVVVECWSEPMGWKSVWKHQLRWARTIRVCQPLPYFLSVLGNATFWPLLWAMVAPTVLVFSMAAFCLGFRIFAATDLQLRLTRSKAFPRHFWLIPVKDALQMLLWVMAFVGNKIEWRGERMRLRRDGTLEKSEARHKFAA